MTMRSIDLLPALRELPASESRERMSFRDMMAGLVNTDCAMFAAEFSSTMSLGLWAIFPGVNVDDDLREMMNQAHERAFPGDDRSVWEHWQDVAEHNDLIAINNTFMSPLKGTAAELHVKEQLNAQGWDVDLADAANQPGWDLHGTNPAGEYTRIQVKGGESYTASDIQEHMDRFPAGDPNYADHYALSPEVYERYVGSEADSGGRTLTAFKADEGGAQGVEGGPEILSANGGVGVSGGAAEVAPAGHDAMGSEVYEQHLGADGEAVQGIEGGLETPSADAGTDVSATAEMAPADHYAMSTGVYDQYIESGADPGGRTLTEIGDYERVQGIEDGLNTLSANEGIDIPDGIVDIVPYAATIVGGARLIHSVLKTEREFRAADRTTRNRIQVVQTLTLMSRMGINTVLAMVGGMGGTAVGSSVPGVGNVVGGIGGLVGGAVMGMRLNKRLQPRMLDLALDITGLTHDDLFYYKNKPRIDAVALSFQTRAGELAAAPSF